VTSKEWKGEATHGRLNLLPFQLVQSKHNDRCHPGHRASWLETLSLKKLERHGSIPHAEPGNE